MIRSRIQAERQARFSLETDPLFFKAAVEQIQQELPYPEG